ncbi:MAG: tRNA pseudouridine(13) synthase TruD [Phycisphaerales bacterium]
MIIRRIPEDFAVEEELAAEVVGSWGSACTPETPVAVYALRKNSLTTPEAVHWLAKSLGVREGLVSHAGLKDKHAVTTQHVSVREPDAKKRAALAAEARGDNGHGWSARRVGWCREDLKSAEIRRNRFRIVVRDLTPADVREMDRRMRLLADAPTGGGGGPAPLVVVNYFGDQRFGSARHGGGWIASHLLRGEFEAALRLAIGTPARKDTGKKRVFSRVAASGWAAEGDLVAWAALVEQLPRCPERRSIEALARGGTFREAFAALPAFTQHMSVEAYQSHLWNEIVRRFVRSLATSPGGSHDSERLLTASDSYGDLVFPEATLVTDAMRRMELPMPSTRVSYIEPWRSLVVDVLADAGLSLDRLTIPGMRRPAFGDAMRRVFADVDEIDMSGPGADELARSKGRLRRTVSFALPRGAYATVLLRAIGC